MRAPPKEDAHAPKITSFRWTYGGSYTAPSQRSQTSVLMPGVWKISHAVPERTSRGPASSDKLLASGLVLFTTCHRRESRGSHERQTCGARNRARCTVWYDLFLSGTGQE